MPAEVSLKAYIDKFEAWPQKLVGEIGAVTNKYTLEYMQYSQEYIPSTVRYIYARFNMSLKFTTDPPDVKTSFGPEQATATFEADIKGDDGESGWVELELYDSDGELAGMVGINSDRIEFQFSQLPPYVTITIEHCPPPEEWADEKVENFRAQTRKQFEEKGFEYP